MLAVFSGVRFITLACRPFQSTIAFAPEGSPVDRRSTWITGEISSRSCRGLWLFRLFIRLKRLQCFADQPAAQLFFLFRGRFGVANDMNDAVPKNDAIRPNHFSDGESRSDLHRRDSRFLQLGRNRSAAARAGSSSRGEYHRIDSLKFGFGRHFTADAACI